MNREVILKAFEVIKNIKIEKAEPLKPRKQYSCVEEYWDFEDKQQWEMDYPYQKDILKARGFRNG
jgi:hypothetical protein